MAHFRCPTSSIVRPTDRYYSNGDSVRHNSTSSYSAYMDSTHMDLLSSGDESASSSSSSTILASRTTNRSSSTTRKATSHRRNSSTQSKMPAPAAATDSFGKQLASSSSQSATQRTTNDQGMEQDRQCWICYGDDSDSEGNWVSPCPCSLVAHEKCLLDWITENQKGSPRKLVHCPQCASCYHLVEKSNLTLSLFGVIDEVVRTIAPYITSLSLGLSLLVVTTTYGASSLILLFGAREGERILGHPSSWTWRTWIGLPSIPVALLSTPSRLADSFLPFFTFLVLRLSSTSSTSSSPFIQFSWPPSPLATLGILPWVRLAYNNIYYAAQGLISRQLSLKIVRDQRHRQQQQQHSNNNPLVLMSDHTTTTQLDHNHTVDPITTNANDITMNTTIEQQTPERSTELDILLGRGPPSVGMLLMSTLLWPVFGNITGSCLSQVAWIRQRLPEPFHRNILGGCLFVVIKDVGNLIYRYQKVQEYRSRRIQNYNEIKRSL